MDDANLLDVLQRASLPELKQLQDGYESGVKSLTDKRNAVRAELVRRFGQSAVQSLAQKDKTHGSVTLDLQDRFRIKGDVKQEVKWDSAALMAIAKTLPWERVTQLFKIDFSMSETVYKGIAAAAPELRERIDAARTTKIKEPSLRIEQEDSLA